ncbi:MAG: TPM domain-containing protein [Treponema sp.]|nr:TPM domain-containing protein [Treponema sp.]
MKKLITLILAAFMIFIPLSAQEDVIPIGESEYSEEELEELYDLFGDLGINIEDLVGDTNFDAEEYDDYLTYDEDLNELINAVNSVLEQMGEDTLPANASIEEVFDTIDRYNLLDEEDSASPKSVESRLYENAETQYKALVKDDADLLSDDEEKTLLEEIIPITTWGNIFFTTADYAWSGAPEEVAADMYEATFGEGTNGAIFLINMGNRKLTVYSDGAMHKIITPNYCQSITDNVYKLATSGDYYSCASQVFAQISTLLAGGKISQPMKHISNYLIALILALIICYIYMRKSPKTNDEKAQPKADPIFNGTLNDISVKEGRLTTRVIQSSSGGGSRGGGGGGHSGGGGSHGF